MAKVAPSILAADPGNLERDVKKVSQYVDFFHIDVMDGHFVPNITYGPLIVEAVNRATKKPIESHLMLSRPDRYLEAFAKAGSDIITVHAEADIQLVKTLKTIRRWGLQAGASVNPSTSIKALDRAWPYIDYLLIMTVKPGFGSQSFIKTVLPKIRKAREIISERALDIPISIDGGVNEETGKEAVEAGADTLVAGSYIYGKNPLEAIKKLKKI